MVALAQINPLEKSSVAPYIERESNGVRNRVHLVGAQRGVQVARHPAKLAFNLLAADVLDDPIYRRKSCFPNRFASFFAEPFYQLVQAQVGNTGDMGGGVGSIKAAATAPVEQDDSMPGLLEQICRRNAGNSRSDDRYVRAAIRSDF